MVRGHVHRKGLGHGHKKWLQVLDTGSGWRSWSQEMVRGHGHRKGLEAMDMDKRLANTAESVARSQAVTQGTTSVCMKPIMKFLIKTILLCQTL